MPVCIVFYCDTFCCAGVMPGPCCYHYIVVCCSRYLGISFCCIVVLRLGVLHSFCSMECLISGDCPPDLHSIPIYSPTHSVFGGILFLHSVLQYNSFSLSTALSLCDLEAVCCVPHVHEPIFPFCV